MDLLTNGALSFHWMGAGLSDYVSIIGGFKLFHCVLLTFLKITGTSQNQNKNTDLEQCKCEKMENLRMLVIAITILWRTTWSGHISQPVYKMSDACPVLGPLNCELVAVCQLAEQSSTSSPSSPTKASSVFCLWLRLVSCQNFQLVLKIFSGVWAKFKIPPLRNVMFAIIFPTSRDHRNIFAVMYNQCLCLSYKSPK